MMQGFEITASLQDQLSVAMDEAENNILPNKNNPQIEFNKNLPVNNLSANVDDLLFPLARVNKILKLDPNLKKISPSVTLTIHSAIIYFLEHLVEESNKIRLSTSNRKTLMPEDLKKVFQKNDRRYEFLEACSYLIFEENHFEGSLIDLTGHQDLDSSKGIKSKNGSISLEKKEYISELTQSSRFTRKSKFRESDLQKKGKKSTSINDFFNKIPNPNLNNKAYTEKHIDISYRNYF